MNTIFVFFFVLEGEKNNVLCAQYCYSIDVPEVFNSKNNYFIWFC